jgi:hypothetical protein
MNLYIAQNGQQTGPFTLDDVNKKIAAGLVQPTDLAWHEGLAGWQALSTISGVAIAQLPNFSIPPIPKQTLDADPIPSPTLSNQVEQITERFNNYMDDVPIHILRVYFGAMIALFFFSVFVSLNLSWYLGDSFWSIMPNYSSLVIYLLVLGIGLCVILFRFFHGDYNQAASTFPTIALLGFGCLFFFFWQLDNNINGTDIPFGQYISQMLSKDSGNTPRHQIGTAIGLKLNAFTMVAFLIAHFLFYIGAFIVRLTGPKQVK